MKMPGRRKRGLSCCAHSRDRRGAAIVEFTVVAPLLILLILGTIDVGQFVNAGQTVSNASRQGARLAARNTTLNVSEVESVVSSYLADSFPNIPAATLDAAVQVDVSDASGDAIPGGDLTTINTGSPVSVAVVLQFDSVRWLKGASLVNNRTLGTTTVMRRE